MRGHRSTSLFEMFKMRHNQSSEKESKPRHNKTIAPKKITIQAKENKSPAKSISTLQPLQDTTNTAEAIRLQSNFHKSKCPSSNQSDNYIPILQLADFHLEPHPCHSSESSAKLKLSKRYRTTESYNNSPINQALANESDIKSSESQGQRKFGRLLNEDGGYYEGEMHEGQP